MTIKELKVLSRNGSIELPDWVKFAFELGSYISEHGIKYKKPINILLSLPSEQFFSLFIAMGIADKFFSLNKQLRSIRKTVLNLTQGSRIIYSDEKSSRKASVICVEPSPVFQNEMILKIKDGNIVRGIPERQWIERVIITDEEFDEIKRTRKVSKNQKVGLDNNKLLCLLYSVSQLNKLAFYPGDYFYLIGNKSQINESMKEKIFIYNGIEGSILDFLYLDNSNSFTNGKLFSSQMNKIDDEINESVPVIYSDLNSYIKQDKNFSENPKLIVSSRTDSESRLQEFKKDLKNRLLQDEHKMVTQDIIDFLTTREAKIPNKIEILAWR